MGQKIPDLLDGVKEGVNGSASAWDELAGAIDNSTGALDAMDATATGTLQGALARFQSAISDLKISMVEDFGPYAMQIIDAVALKIPDITAGFSELIQKLPIQEFMNGVGQKRGTDRWSRSHHGISPRGTPESDRKGV